MTWIDPRTWVAGETVTAAHLNTHLRDNLKALGDPWTLYTVSWTGGGGNPSIGNGTLVGRYVQVGKLVHVQMQIVAGSTTTYGSGNYSFSLPFAPHAGNRHPVGLALFWDNSALDRRGWPCFTFAGGVQAFHPTTGGVAAQGAPFTLATSDEISIQCCYQAA